MNTLELPKSFDDFVDARKAGFLKVKDYVENGGHLVGMFCSYTPVSYTHLDVYKRQILKCC